MMALPVEDTSPLIAALPPETDYMTYLTLLEYQLTPSNLPILTQLLTADDGTLAKEIGWDLLKLVLPLSEVVPEEVSKCLEIVARRGNPKEVVVQVTAELEGLGHEDHGESSGGDQEFEDDGRDDRVHTFPGEAEPIHLGAMTLEGMPSAPTQRPGEAARERNENEQARRSDSSKADLRKFEILLSMLSILHPRIQTAHPSRFLATSLPAAIGSYRRLPIDFSTTTAFLSLIGKLSGKQRPALPPRAATAATGEMPPTAAVHSESQLAPLPDPEPQLGTTSPSSLAIGEAAIMQRLLQAVLIEVLEEYVLSLATQEPPSMAWTARLREMREPGKVVRRRQTEMDKWSADPGLQERDTLIRKFVDLSHDLGVDLKKFSQDSPTAASAPTAVVGDAAESPPEYPTSAEQIPFPKVGAFLLLVAHYFAAALTAPHKPGPISTYQQTPLHLTYELTGLGDNSRLSALLSLPTPALDSLIAVLYAVLFDDISGPPTMLLFQTSLYSEIVVHFLTDLCSNNPELYIRDSAHATATVIFHRCSPEIKLRVLKHMLKTSQNPSLRAIAVGWLKDDIVGKGASSLQPDILVMDAELADALCAPPRSDDFVAQLPFHVAVLNLLTIVPTDQGDWLTHALTKLRSDLSDEEVQQLDIPPINLWSFDDALQRAKDAFAKQDSAARLKSERKDEWLHAT